MNILLKLLMSTITVFAAVALSVAKSQQPLNTLNGFEEAMTSSMPKKVIAQAASSSGSGNMKSMSGMDHSKMNHKPIQVPGNKLIPQISLSLHRDPMDGFNLHINVNNFELEAPEFAHQKPKNWLQGHAHLFVNGVKVQRVYSPFVHIPGKHLSSGPNQLMLSLNAHNHDYWSNKNKPIMASIFFDPNKDEFVLHSFSASPVSKH